MLWVDAERVVAVMADFHSFRYVSHEEPIRETVRPDMLRELPSVFAYPPTAVPQSSVLMRGRASAGSCPEPAALRPRDLKPEPLFRFESEPPSLAHDGFGITVLAETLVVELAAPQGVVASIASPDFTDTHTSMLRYL